MTFGEIDRLVKRRQRREDVLLFVVIWAAIVVPLAAVLYVAMGLS